MEVFPGIVQDPDRRFGKPCLKGTRIDVATILGALAAGEEEEAICENYQITKKQISDALEYGAHVAQHVPPAQKGAA